MTEKRLSSRVSEIEYLKVKQTAESVGMGIAEFTRFAALNIGKASNNNEETTAAMAVILDRIDEQDSRFLSIETAQQRIDSALAQQDETLTNIAKAISRIIDHLSQKPAQQSTQPAPQPLQPAAQETARPAYKKAADGTFSKAYTESGSTQSRPDWYRSNLRDLVQKFGWDGRVNVEHYQAANLNPPPDLFQ